MLTHGHEYSRTSLERLDRQHALEQYAQGSGGTNAHSEIILNLKMIFTTTKTGADMRTVSERLTPLLSTQVLSAQV